MRRKAIRVAVATLPLVVLLAWTTMPAAGQNDTKIGEWRAWGADERSTQYSPLDQINKDNVKTLRIAWRWKSDNFGPRADYNWEATPLMIGGVLYTTAGARRDVVAIDAATGETLWMWRYDEGERGARAVRNQNRGLAYWTDGKEARILYNTPGYHLIALSAKTGQAIPGFGTNGIVDLYEGLDQPLPKDGVIGASSPPLVVGDIAVIGAALLAGGAPPAKENTAAFIRGYDVRTGKRVWIFHTIPRPGEFGNETWLNDSWSYTGNTAAWAPMSADLELGYVYLPLEGSTGDFYGGHRPGSNLFSDSLVCLDAKTGKRVWHRQLIHHDIWDWDIASAPNIVDIVKDGKKIKAVAQVTKQAWVYVFDRVTGEPVWPMEERPVPKGEVPGEWYSPTQLYPTKPAPFDRQGVTVDDLIDFTPELKAEAMQIASQYQIGPIFTPQIVGGANGKRGFLMVPAATGAANWESAGIDPETGVIYIPSVTNLSIQALQPGGTRSNMSYISGAPAGGDPDAGPRPAAGLAGATATAAAGGRGGAAPVLGPGVTRGPWGIGPQGLPLLKPPYGRITAIDLNTGERLWQVANGDTYEWIKNHPALKGITIPKTGKSDVGGVAVTKTLLFAGEGCGLFRTAGGGPMFYAYDKKTGDVVWEFKLPAGACGNPMTYMVNGKQYITVAAGARNTPAELVALTLP